jgi:hypothetical protein
MAMLFIMAKMASRLTLGSMETGGTCMRTDMNEGSAIRAAVYSPPRGGRVSRKACETNNCRQTVCTIHTQYDEAMCVGKPIVMFVMVLLLNANVGGGCQEASLLMTLMLLREMCLWGTSQKAHSGKGLDRVYTRGRGTGLSGARLTCH